MVGPGRFELPTSRLSGVRSDQLSYGPEFCGFLLSYERAGFDLGIIINPKGFSLKGGDPSAPSGTDTLLRLNPNHPPHLRPTNRTSGVGDFHGLTGGVYKTRERIHRSMLICDY